MFPNQPNNQPNSRPNTGENEPDQNLWQMFMNMPPPQYPPMNPATQPFPNQFSSMNLYSQGFSQFSQPQFGGYPPQPFQSSPTPRPSPTSQQTPTPRASQPFSLQDEDDEIVQETQEVGASQPKQRRGKSKRSHKKKEDDARTTKEIQFWNDDECYALCRAYIEASENPTKANNQDAREFWDEIRSKFFTLMGKGEYRNPDSLSSKWREINRKCQAFSTYYDRSRSNWPSGANDADIYDRAVIEYGAERGHFTLKRCWSFLYQSEKWRSKADITTRQTRKSKKSKTSSSADPESFDSTARTFEINLNDSDNDDEDDAPTPPVETTSGRPRGRDFARANRGKAPVTELQAVMAESIQDLARSKKKQVEQIDDYQLDKDLEFLAQDPPENANPVYLALHKKKMERIKRKYKITD